MALRRLPQPTPSRRRPRPSYTSRPHAEDEDPFGRQEALQAHQGWQGQEGPGSACRKDPHPAEEEPEEEAADGQRSPRASAGSPAREGAARQEMRVKRSTHARKKRREVLERTKGYRGEANHNYKRAKEALIKAETYAYRDRRNKKRDFRRLWITRINAAAKLNGMSYSQFMHGLKLSGIELDRKVLADVAVRDPETFRRFVETAREAAAA